MLKLLNLLKDFVYLDVHLSLLLQYIFRTQKELKRLLINISEGGEFDKNRKRLLVKRSRVGLERLRQEREGPPILSHFDVKLKVNYLLI